MPRRSKAPLESLETQDQQDIRKLRNRLSQQAFRRRRATLIRELRERADINQPNASDALLRAREENSALRTQLAEAHTKLNSLLATVQSLVTSTAPKSDTPVISEDCVPLPSLGPSSSPEDLLPLGCDHAIASCTQDTIGLAPTWPSSEDCHDLVRSESALTPVDTTVSFPSSSLGQQLPNVWSLEYQMGPQIYSDALMLSEESSAARGQNWVQSNSAFSDHIEFIQQQLRQRTETLDSPLPTDLLYVATSSVLSIFNTASRYNALHWYARTKFRYTRDFTVWKVRPCPETYQRLDSHYQPTLLQQKYDHPIVIDWIPFPSARDCLITYHAANPCIDTIISDIVSAYVVEALLSDLVIGSPPIRVYIKVIDLVQATANKTKNYEQRLVSLPVSEASQIFTSADISQSVSTLVKIQDGPRAFKLDPQFFVRYPEFYEGSAHLLAQGVPLSPKAQTTLAFPNLLNDGTASLYSDSIDFILSSIVKDSDL